MDDDAVRADTGAEEQDLPAEKPPAGGRKTKAVIITLVVLAFVAVALVRPIGSVLDPKVVPGKRTLTSQRNDATAEYEAAVASGKPIYVLFHSLS